MDPYAIIAYTMGIALDFTFGDPRNMPHIVRAIGFMINKGESIVTSLIGRSVFSGILLWIGVIAFSVICYLLLSHLFFTVDPWLKVVFDALVIFQCIAFKDLVKHVRAVKQALNKSITKARKRVSWISGRDTE